jgi:4a-hydroxytetrahydrobiopterin dehydratase
MSDLFKKKCIECQTGTPPLKTEALKKLKSQINPHWELVKQAQITREFLFKNFKQALEFTNQIGQLAEQEGHHPNIELSWGRAKVTLFTHKINGLSENDFILAAKIDEQYGKKH